MVVIAVRGCDTLFAWGYGLADLENDVRMTAAHVFQLASVTEQFTPRPRSRWCGTDASTSMRRSPSTSRTSRSDFNYDFQVSFDAEAAKKGRAYYNYSTGIPVQEDVLGISVFYKDRNGDIITPTRLRLYRP